SLERRRSGRAAALRRGRPLGTAGRRGRPPPAAPATGQRRAPGLPGPVRLWSRSAGRIGRGPTDPFPLLLPSGIGAGRDRGTTSPARPRPPACSSWPTTETAAHVKRPGHTARQHLEQPPGQPSGYSGEHAPGTPKPSQLPGSRLPKCWGQASDEGLIDDHLPHREFVARVIWAQPTSLSHGLPSASDQGPRL
ncbi:unnamed protein product, partial [Prorocentrum cordatum]